MTSQRTIKISISTPFVLLIVALIVLSAFAAPAQQADTSQPSEKSSAQTVHPAQPTVDGAGRVAANHLQGKRRDAGVMTPDNSFSFLPVVTYDSGEVGANSIAVGDVNGDGKPDLVVANCGAGDSACISFNAATVGVLLGNGDGTFQPVVTYGSGGLTAVSVVIEDVNGDGLPDLLVANLGFGGGLVGVLLGNGDGTFKPAVSYSSGGQFASSVAVADVNGDGKPDLVVANKCADSNCDGSVGVLLGNGDGTFQAAVAYRSGGPEAFSVTVADVNGDSKPDILVTTEIQVCGGGSCYPVNAVGVLLGTGDGTFGTAVTYGSGGLFAGFFTAPIVVADLNGDGKPDLVVENGACCAGVPKGAVGVLLGNGDGTFQTVVIHKSSAEGPGTSVALADIDGDGKPDLVVTDLCANNNCFYQGLVGVMLGNGNGTFQSEVTFSAGGSLTNSVAVADLNGDGKPDLVVANGCADSGVSCPGGSVGVLLNNSGISHAATTTTLVSSLNPSIVGQAVTFTATVSSSAGTPPNGEIITFKNGSAVLGTAALSGGIASLTTSSLPAGIFTITANYPGDSTFAASTSPGLRQVVNSTTKSATVTTLVSSLNPSVYGQKVVFTATVTTSGSVPPTGKVSFKWNGYTLGSATLNASGVATLTRSNLNADTYPLTAVYVGDASNLGSTSSVVSQVVAQATSSATLTSSPNPSTSGQAVTFTATITSPTVTPTGPVTFAVGTTVLGTAQLSGGKATFATSTLAVGSTQVTATYYGDSNIAKSSASVTQTVQ